MNGHNAGDDINFSRSKRSLSPPTYNLCKVVRGEGSLLSGANDPFISRIPAYLKLLFRR